MRLFLVRLWLLQPFFLILPGFATDFLGLLIIFPPTRKLIFKKVSIKQKPINEKTRFLLMVNFEDIG